MHECRRWINGLCSTYFAPCLGVHGQAVSNQWPLKQLPLSPEHRLETFTSHVCSQRILFTPAPPLGAWPTLMWKSGTQINVKTLGEKRTSEYSQHHSRKHLVDVNHCTGLALTPTTAVQRSAQGTQRLQSFDSSLLETHVNRFVSYTSDTDKTMWCE